jgi:D-tyrosyl-tRNA(Tyr) deacylase
VTRGAVTANGLERRIGSGLVVLLGVGTGDAETDALLLAEKTANLRIFSNAGGKFDHSVLETGGEALVVSQFTLYGDASKGRRPDFTAAARPAEANELYQRYVAALEALGVPVKTGVFAADMEVEIVNDGPVTILLDTKKQ